MPPCPAKAIPPQNCRPKPPLTPARSFRDEDFTSRYVLRWIVLWALQAFGQPVTGDGGVRGLEGADRGQALGWWPQRAFGEIAGQRADQRHHGVRAGRAARPR